MKNSERNLAVIENFILHLTHCSDEKEPTFTEPQTYTPEELYRVAFDYIEEDHVDGKENPEDDKAGLRVDDISFSHGRDYENRSTVYLEVSGERFESIAAIKTADLTKLGFKK